MSKGVQEVLKGDERKVLVLINSGCKVFERYDATIYRIAQEGVDWMAPYVTKRVVKITEKELLSFFQVAEEMLITAFSENTQKQFNSFTPGPCLIIVESTSPNPTGGWNK